MPSLVRVPVLPVAALAAALAIAPLHAQDKSQAEQAAAKQKLSNVHQEVQALGKQQAATAAHRDELNAELAKQTTALAAAARALRQADAEIAARQQQLGQLRQQRADLQQKLASQRAAIADLLRASYALGHGSDLRLLLDNDDMDRIARALVYSKYFQQDRLQKVQQLMAGLAQLQALEQQITAEQQALQAQRDQRETQSRQLAQQRAAQQKLAAEADATYQDQSQRLAALKQDEQSLNSLVARLQQQIDEAMREAAARAAAQQAAARKHGGKAPPPLEVGSAGADIRGNLPWPASGEVHSYGNGVLIRAPGGSEVRAVANGRVVYAGFLRGYGMLLILNHGNGWMSMYGNNETLLHAVGDAVKAGEAVGTASAPTGINTGAYFELRHGIQPVDPRSWLKSH
ncbi:peptidoglycan DD-metalloendopeptidase family protein [Rhodanobacter sp. DHB23]|uniref:murein hydrolase activator EnvC family protein n=1 Tax=Rhodanobacter sp. DHB23 TaxID=2775923 RepID=UPI00177A8545|nr:peptidoglycan DD-metalloendopeptidase family protein [Rhodanobacter sp. DHB23]MBD8872741.1 peptidoglycan DD-metalloendopeptidase family protein [Rhodanobacter sp. DHB23]